VPDFPSDNVMRLIARCSVLILKYEKCVPTEISDIIAVSNL
jgi:hypothetical protein